MHSRKTRKAEVRLMLHLFPHGIAGLGDGWATGKSPEHMHQHIQAPVAFNDFRDPALDLIQFIEIDRHRFEIGFREIRRSNPQRSPNDTRSLLQKRPGNRRTECPVGAGDKDNSIFHGSQSFSGPSLWQRVPQGPKYVKNVAKVQIWCPFAEVDLGEASFSSPVM